MSLRIRIFVIICMVLLLISLIRLMSKKKINYRYGLGWALIDIVIIVFAGYFMVSHFHDAWLQYMRLLCHQGHWEKAGIYDQQHQQK